MFHFTAYIMAPGDSVYRHKLVKLEFEIPARYPIVPPIVKFIQHSGERIHPNLYVQGKVCLSILGTWPGEPWAFSMKCDSVLITIRSLLDNKPYLHEPNQQDYPRFNEYVRYTTWRWLLLDSLEHETNPAARAWLRRWVRRNGREMLIELRRQARMAEIGVGGDSTVSGALAAVPAAVGVRPGSDKCFVSPYKRTELLMPTYDRLIQKLEAVYMSTLEEAVESLDSGSGNGNGSEGSMKRKITAVETSEGSSVGGQLHGDQKQQQQTEKLNEAIASHEPLPLIPQLAAPEGQFHRPKKRAKEDPEITDLT